MRRVIAVSMLVLATAAAVAVVAVSRSRSSGNAAVAEVEGRTITRHDLDLMVEHFHEDADREGRLFPNEGTGAFRTVQRRALALLIYRRRLEVAAARIGVRVSSAEVERQVARSAGGEDEGAAIRAKAEAAFVRSTVRTQLLTQRVFARVTRGVAVTAAAVRGYYRSHRAIYGRTPFRELARPIRLQLLAARRNLAMNRWLQSAERIPAKIRDDDLRG